MAGRALSAFLGFILRGDRSDEAQIGELMLGDAFVTFNTWFNEWCKRTPMPRKRKH
jgi:hypothetical protein